MGGRNWEMSGFPGLVWPATHEWLGLLCSCMASARAEDSGRQQPVRRAGGGILGKARRLGGRGGGFAGEHRVGGRTVWGGVGAVWMREGAPVGQTREGVLPANAVWAGEWWRGRSDLGEVARG